MAESRGGEADRNEGEGGAASVKPSDQPPAPSEPPAAAGPEEDRLRVRKLVTVTLVLALACAYFWWNAYGTWLGIAYGTRAFLVVTAIAGEELEAYGYPRPREGEPFVFEPGDVLVCGIAHGMVLFGTEFAYREIALIDAGDAGPVARLAGPGEDLAMRRPLEVFGVAHPVGIFAVPEDSKMPAIRIR